MLILNQLIKLKTCCNSEFQKDFRTRKPIPRSPLSTPGKYGVINVLVCVIISSEDEESSSLLLKRFIKPRAVTTDPATMTPLLKVLGQRPYPCQEFPQALLWAQSIPPYSFILNQKPNKTKEKMIVPLQPANTGEITPCRPKANPVLETM